MEELSSIIQRLQRQHAAIQTALEALREIDGSGSVTAAPRRGRPHKQGSEKSGTQTEKAPTHGNRITEAGRQRLRQAMKRRWAVKRAAAAAKKIPAKKTITKRAVVKNAAQKKASDRFEVRVG